MEKIKDKVVLITGGTGFIGANLIRRIYKNNQVHLFLKKSSNQWRIKDIQKKLFFHFQDLSNVKQLKKITKKINPKYIFHLAAHGAYSYQTDQTEIIKTNLIGTVNLITSLSDVNYDCFVNTGSSSEYGFKGKPMKETDLLEPNSFYAATKAASSYFADVHAKTYNKPVITIRPFSVFGPYEEKTRLIPTLITRILDGKAIELTKENIRRDFIYVDDLIDGYLTAAKKINKQIYGQIFNIGTGKQYTNYQIAREILKITKIKVRIKKGAFRARIWDSPFWVADISKAVSILGWSPEYNLSDGLRKTVNWFVNNRKYYY